MTFLLLKVVFFTVSFVFSGWRLELGIGRRSLRVAGFDFFFFSFWIAFVPAHRNGAFV